MNSQDLFLLVALGFLIFMMVWSSRKRKKQAAELEQKLSVGATVMLHSGIIGNITELQDVRAVIETTPGVKLTVVKQAIRSVESNPLIFGTAKAESKPAAKTTSKPVAKSTAKSSAKAATKPSTKKA